MSTSTARRGKHALRLPTRRDWRAEAQRLEREVDAAREFFTRLTADRDQVYQAWEQAKADLGRAEEELVKVAGERDTAVIRTEVAEARVAELEAELVAAQAEIDNLTAIHVPATRPAPEDEETMPIDTRTVRETFGDDYLDRTQIGWTIPPIPVMPLYEAPFAMNRPPTTPTDLPGKTETTLTIRLNQADTTAA